MPVERITKIELYNSKTRPDKTLWDIQVEGGDTFVLNGIVIHNSDVEFGIDQDRPISGTQTINKRSYRRRGYRRKDGVYVGPATVKAHSVRLVGKRIIFVRPKLSKFEYQPGRFVAISKIRARKGQYFLTRAVKAGIKDLSKDMSIALKRVGNVTGG